MLVLLAVLIAAWAASKVKCISRRGLWPRLKEFDNVLLDLVDHISRLDDRLANKSDKPYCPNLFWANWKSATKQLKRRWLGATPPRPKSGAGA